MMSCVHTDSHTNTQNGSDTRATITPTQLPSFIQMHHKQIAHTHTHNKCPNKVTSKVASFLFLGTGVSSGIPQLCHLLSLCDDTKEACVTCKDAYTNPESKNRRNNVCSLLTLTSGKRVLVDVGKTFRDSAIRSLVKHNVQRIDAVVLTHDHADAMGGLDDLRDFQIFKRPDDNTHGAPTYKPESRIPVFLSKCTYESVQDKFDYIVNASQETGPLIRKIAVLDFILLDDTINSECGFDSFSIDGCRVVAIPVWHGNDYVCLGFVIDADSDKPIVYISDVSEIPKSVDEYVSTLPDDKILVLDLIHLEFTHFSHFTAPQALEYIERWQPKAAYFVGMGCGVGHTAMCTYMSKWLHEKKQQNPLFKTDVLMPAFDGQVLDFT